MVFKKLSLYESWLGAGRDKVSIYADNDTILNGFMFYKLAPIRDEMWYKRLGDSEGLVVMFVFGKEKQGILIGQ